MLQISSSKHLPHGSEHLEGSFVRIAISLPIVHVEAKKSYSTKSHILDPSRLEETKKSKTTYASLEETDESQIIPITVRRDYGFLKSIHFAVIMSVDEEETRLPSEYSISETTFFRVSREFTSGMRKIL